MEVSCILKFKTRHFRVLIPQISNRGDNRSALNSLWKQHRRIRITLLISPPTRTNLPYSEARASPVTTDLASGNLTLIEVSWTTLCTTIKAVAVSNIIKEKVIKPLKDVQAGATTPTMTEIRSTSMLTRSTHRVRKTVVIPKNALGSEDPRTTSTITAI